MTKLANPFDTTLATLAKDFPAKFVLEVEEHVFMDLPSTQDAYELSDAMEKMKSTAMKMGYNITTTHDMASRRWVYAFNLRPGHVKPKADHEIKPALPAAPVDPIAALSESPAVPPPSA